MNAEILTLKELSGYLKSSKSTIYRLAQQGEIPCSKVGRNWRFKKERIDKWLFQQERHNKNKQEG